MLFNFNIVQHNSSHNNKYAHSRKYINCIISIHTHYHRIATVIGSTDPTNTTNNATRKKILCFKWWRCSTSPTSWRLSTDLLTLRLALSYLPHKKKMHISLYSESHDRTNGNPVKDKSWWCGMALDTLTAWWHGGRWHPCGYTPYSY